MRISFDRSLVLKKQEAYSFSAYLISKADSTQVKKASPFYVYGL
jgi:hypothetical protein